MIDSLEIIRGFFSLKEAKIPPRTPPPKMVLW
jgi:hypothetical protein